MAAVTQLTGYRAKHRYARMTARKARLIADVIRGRSANEALEILQFAHQRAAAYYLRLLKSAMANAAQDEGVNVNRLYVADARADDGPMLNNRLRWRPGPQGRAMPFAKKTSHLTIVVAEVADVADAAKAGVQETQETGSQEPPSQESGD